MLVCFFARLLLVYDYDSFRRRGVVDQFFQRKQALGSTIVMSALCHSQTSPHNGTSLIVKTETPRTPGAFASSVGPSPQVPLLA